MEHPLNYVMEDLHPNMVEKARIELGETPERKENAIRELRSLIQKEKNLVIPTNDAYLVQYLRSRKYDVERTFKVIRNFWKIKQDNVRIYENINPERMKEIFMMNILGYLPHRDKDGATVLIVNPRFWDPDKVPFESTLQGFSTLLYSAIKYPATQVCGFRVLADCRELSWKQLKMATPYNVYFLAYALQIMIHDNNLDALKQYIDSSVLPPEFGGEGEPFDNNKKGELCDEFTREFIELMTYGYKN